MTISTAVPGIAWTRRFFTPAPDSLIGTSCAGGKPRWAMLWNLIWLPWMFGDVLNGMRVPADWWPVTIATLLVFLLLYACASLRPGRERPSYALAMAALALAVMPVSQFASGTLLIYACAYLALQPTLLRLLARVVPVMLAWALATRLLGWPWQSEAWVLLVAFAIAVGQHSFWARIQSNAELRLTHDEVRRLAASAERERIGRDLHDLLGQTLSMVALKSELAGRLVGRDAVAARREMADVERVAREALAQVRSAVSGIRAAALASEFAAARLLLETSGVHLDCWNDGSELPPDVESCLALVLREAVTNVQRHARARRVEVTVAATHGGVAMRIRDDGRGGAATRGNGLTGMQERVSARHGTLVIASPRGGGTTIEARLPVAATVRYGHDAPARLPSATIEVPEPVAGRA